MSDQLPPCNQEIYDKGTSVCLVDIPKETAEHICRSLTEATGIPIDWHYIGGRVHIKALVPKTQLQDPVEKEVENVWN